MGSFAWEIETFGTKDKQLRISRGVINWLGVHPPIQNLPQKTICCLFSRAWHETKQRLGFRTGKSKNKFSFGLLVWQWNFQITLWTESDLCPFHFLHSVLYQTKPVSITWCFNESQMRHCCFWWKWNMWQNVGKQQFLIFWHFLYWGARVVIFNLPLWDKT